MKGKRAYSLMQYRVLDIHSLLRASAIVITTTITTTITITSIKLYMPTPRTKAEYQAQDTEASGRMPSESEAKQGSRVTAQRAFNLLEL